MLSAIQLRATARSIASVQRQDGCIPWFPGGHADPWNHVEAAMALDVAGLRTQALRAYEWLASCQRPDGSWACSYLEGGIEEPTSDSNFDAYIAVGVWHHYLATGDAGFLAAYWPTVESAVDFVLDLQCPGGEIIWCRDGDGSPGGYALLTASSSIHTSLRCALAAARRLGHERPDWEVSTGALAHAVACHPEAFEPKDRWSMDWYYPVLGGVVTGAAARARLARRWSDFVIEGRGARCVSDRPWVTAAETCELVMALDATGLHTEARRLFEWVHFLRAPDGAYWTGMVFPEEIHFPDEQTTYTAAAVVLAADTLARRSPTSGLFRGEGLPRGLDPSPVNCCPAEAH
jgi:hypothetical protein